MANAPAHRLHPWIVPLKYGLAVGLAAAAASHWVPKDVISAAFVAILCCRPAVTSALRETGAQFMASALGIAVAIVFMALLGAGPLAMGLGIAAVWSIARGLAWEFPVTLVAGFSVVYMDTLAPVGWADWAFIRVAAVGIGVTAALVVNLLAAPWLGAVNLSVRLEATRLRVSELLAALAAALRAGDAGALATVQGQFDAAYQSLRDVRLELADLRQDARVARDLLRRPGGEARDRASLAAQDLEMVVHYAQDVAASNTTPATVPALEAIVSALELVGVGQHREAAEALLAALPAVKGQAPGQSQWALLAMLTHADLAVVALSAASAKSVQA